MHHDIMTRVVADSKVYDIWEANFISLNACKHTTFFAIPFDHGILLVAALTFQVWDALICLDDEIRYIWPSVQEYSMHGILIDHLLKGSLAIVRSNGYFFSLDILASWLKCERNSCLGSQLMFNPIGG